VWYENDGRVNLGFRQQHSKTIAAIRSCLVLAPALNALIEPLQRWLEQLHSAKAVTHVELVLGGSQVAVILRHTKKLRSGWNQMAIGGLPIWKVSHATRGWNIRWGMYPSLFIPRISPR
jgi:tRNA/tmRNA/rRNA uracil-C5-methylase (TrmA/RlmC/RlmD family)